MVKMIDTYKYTITNKICVNLQRIARRVFCDCFIQNKTIMEQTIYFDRCSLYLKSGIYLKSKIQFRQTSINKLGLYLN